MRKSRPRVHALKLAKKSRQRLSKALGKPVKVIMCGSRRDQVFGHRFTVTTQPCSQMQTLKDLACAVTRDKQR